MKKSNAKIFFHTLVQLIKKYNQKSNNHITGFSTEEIQSYETHHAIELHNSYREFLLNIGIESFDFDPFKRYSSTRKFFPSNQLYKNKYLILSESDEIDYWEYDLAIDISCQEDDYNIIYLLSDEKPNYQEIIQKDFVFLEFIANSFAFYVINKRCKKNTAIVMGDGSRESRNQCEFAIENIFSSYKDKTTLHPSNNCMIIIMEKIVIIQEYIGEGKYLSLSIYHNHCKSYTNILSRIIENIPTSLVGDENEDI